MQRSENYHVENENAESDEVMSKTNKKDGRKEACTKFAYGFLEMSSIHGFNHLTQPGRHWAEHLLWATFISLGVIGTIFLAMQSYRRFSYDATVVAIERDYQTWHTSLPSAYICALSKYNQTRLDEYISRTKHNKEATRDFIVELANVSFDSLWNKKVNFEKLNASGVDIKPENYMKTLHNVSFLLDRMENVNSSTWDIAYNITVTERGLCNGLNSDVSAFNSPEFFFLPSHVKYHPKGKSRVMEGTPIGGHLGLETKELNDAILSMFTPTKDVPDISSKISTTEKGSFSFYEFTTTSAVCAPEVNDLTVTQRGCRFWNESNLEISTVYTFNWCRMNCRWRLAQEYCGCAPHFYKKIEYLIELKNTTTGKKAKCECMQMCEDSMYLVDDRQKIQWYNSTNMEWSVKQFPRIRYRRELIFGSTDFLINIGGLAGFFLGCSVLSFTEIIYYFTIRLIIHVTKKTKS